NTNTYEFIFFFFQAEDGIRDRNVTGVQTCALPIYRGQVESQEGASVGAPSSDTAVDHDGDEHEEGDHHMSTDIRAAQGAVANFMRAAGQLSDGLSAATRRERRVELIREELDELKEAYVDRDREEMADAVADRIYTTLGAGVDEGDNGEAACEEPRPTSNSVIH